MPDPGIKFIPIFSELKYLMEHLINLYPGDEYLLSCVKWKTFQLEFKALKTLKNPFYRLGF